MYILAELSFVNVYFNIFYRFCQDRVCIWGITSICSAWLKLSFIFLFNSLFDNLYFWKCKQNNMPSTLFTWKIKQKWQFVVDNKSPVLSLLNYLFSLKPFVFVQQFSQCNIVLFAQIICYLLFFPFLLRDNFSLIDCLVLANDVVSWRIL